MVRKKVVPQRDSQAAEPTPEVGELQIWRDSDDSKVRLLYRDTTAGNVSGEAD